MGVKRQGFGACSGQALQVSAYAAHHTAVKVPKRFLRYHSAMKDFVTARKKVEERLVRACQVAGRDRATVTMIAVSKTRSSEDIRALHALGQQHFAENYVQEFVSKHDCLAEDPTLSSITWHFIGALQANKTRPIAERAAWVHTIDRLKIAERLSRQRPDLLPPLQVCLEVDLSLEPGKAGVAESQLLALAEAVVHLPRLQLRGLMAIPAPAVGLEAQRVPFARLRQWLERLNELGFGLDTLSMGMSDDFEAAILEGATLVRVGTALFGARGGLSGAAEGPLAAASAYLPPAG
jgi:pyridoxal phosphate enzyme (YggS family)